MLGPRKAGFLSFSEIGGFARCRPWSSNSGVAPSPEVVAQSSDVRMTSICCPQLPSQLVARNGVGVGRARTRPPHTCCERGGLARVNAPVAAALRGLGCCSALA